MFLVGPMGAGKSAIGRALARALGCPFHDTDAEIERRTGVDIAFIFEKEGEAGFRARERQVVAELAALPGIVLATGGGAVLSKHNRDALKAGGTVIYLATSIDQQLRRTRRRTHRPLLDTPNPRERLTTLMAEREPLYQEVADLTVDTDGHRVPVMVRKILAALDNADN